MRRHCVEVDTLKDEIRTIKKRRETHTKNSLYFSEKTRAQQKKSKLWLHLSDVYAKNEWLMQWFELAMMNCISLGTSGGGSGSVPASPPKRRVRITSSTRVFWRKRDCASLDQISRPWAREIIRVIRWVRWGRGGGDNRVGKIGR